MAREVDYIEIVAQASGQQELQKVGGIVDELMKRAKNAGVSVDDLAEKMKKLGKKAENTQPYNAFIGKMKQIAGITAVGMGIKKSISMFTAFDDVARRVQGTTGANAETMELLRYQAKELGRTTSWSASEAAEAQFEFAKAGFSNNEILAATPGILDTATAAQMGLAEATEITAGALRMFGLDASKSIQVGDMLTKTASSTTTDVRDLAESLKYSGNGAKQFGLSLEQTLGILGQLGNLSLKGSQAGTALQAVFSTLQNSKKQEMLMNIGVQLTEDGSYRNILDIIEDIKDKTKGMEKAQRESFISQVFQEQGSQAMNRLLDTPKEELDKLINEVQSSSGFASQLAKILGAGVGGAFKNLTSATEGLGISFGQYLTPAIIDVINIATQLISAGTGFIDWLNSGSYVANALTFTISALTAGFLAYKGVLIATTIWEKALTTASAIKNGILFAGNIAMSAATIVTALFTGNMFLATTATTALTTALAILTSPVALIVGAIVGLGIGFYMLYKKSERFRKGVDALISPLKELWGWIKKFSFVEGIIDFGKNVYNKAKDFVTAGTQGKTNEETEKEIQDRVNQVKNNPNQASNEVSAGTGQGVNTDYLLSGSGTGNGKIKHNGYYLKGTKNSGTNGSVYNNSSSSSNSNNVYTSAPVEKTIEEKMLDTLLAIKNLLSFKGEKSNNTATNNSQIVININKGDNISDIISQVVEDLTVILGNI
ncbi:phage tail tape measure protein [Fusobacterium mortiferum]|uniref:Phage tail tape measure protein n=1 Tax=Fusobacterium mortiferum ATCC 9817 TaxID=469616 RepID=A0ABM6TXQ0_FUSMR|nr:phage tail tape measure protein [Fusobacterium mortiferum]AVQ19194.1 phage tail tape measure protein [Fusobacterium mortiferum ATCC 9817]EEO36411.1 phage tail tape measure protein, TP901 family [Fusobacterium mortiferum ATCC 9817]